MKALSEKAVLVRLKLGRFQPYAYDPTATQQVNSHAGVERAGRFNKRLLHDSPYLQAANSAFNAVYALHTRLTLPWLDDGLRILPADMYLKYTSDMRQVISKARQEAATLASHWQDEVERDAQRLGSLYNAADYPQQIEDRFYAQMQFLPVPSAGDFRVDIDENDMASLEQAVKDAETKAARHVVQTMLEPIAKAAEKLSVPIGADGSVFRDSLMGNISEMVDRVKFLNITEDSEIDAAIQRIEQFTQRYETRVDVLRTGPTTREVASQEVSSIVKNLQDVLGRFA
jgi:hypothetical protein